jgi:hypothetical protein
VKNQNKYQVTNVDGFEKDLTKITRKYPTSIGLVEGLFEKFQQGTFDGDMIPKLKLKGDKVFKASLENRDANNGKRGGFRVIWYLVTTDYEIYPLTISPKNDQEDISIRDVISLIKKQVVCLS